MERNENWKHSLRSGTASKSADNLKRKKMKKMRFGPSFGSNEVNRSTKTRSDPHGKRKSVLRHSLSADEVKLAGFRQQHWSTTRGFIQKASNPVSADQYFRYFAAFQCAAKRSKSKRLPSASSDIYGEAEGSISALDIYGMAKQQGIGTNIGEVNRIADMIDSDGSRMITFAEMVHSLQEMREQDEEPFVGGMVSLEMLLLTHSRRALMVDIASKLSSTKEIDKMLSAFVGDLYWKNRANFSSSTRKNNVCSYCRHKFKYSNELREHLLNEHQYDGAFFTCYQCGEEWIPKNKRLSHIAKHRQIDGAKDGFKCSICRTVFGSRGSLAFHNAENHKPLKLDILQCVQCHDHFSTKEQLQKHREKLHFDATSTQNVKDMKSGSTTKKRTRRTSIVGIGRRAVKDLVDDGNFAIMTPAEYSNIQQNYLSHCYRNKRGEVKNRVLHIQTIQKLRNQYDDRDRRVSILGDLFNRQDQMQSIKEQGRHSTDMTNMFSF